MAHDLNIPAIADGQADSQWQTSNDGDAALGNALADIYTVDFSAGNVTLTSVQFRSAMTFVPSGLSATRALTVPAVKRALFFVHNTDASDSITVTRGATTVSVPAGRLGTFYTDGTANGLVGSVATTGVSGDVVGPASATDGAFAQYDGATGKLLKDGMSKATAAQVRSATTDKVLTSDLIESASALVTLTDGANISLDWDAGINRALTIGGNRTLDNPTNGQPGTWRTIIITQDGTGTRTLVYGNQYKFPGGTEPVLTTAAASVDVLNILCVTTSNFYVFVANDMKV
ncbi:hypothetical protein D3227_25745 [Mesorhizobium waimense]|uniref:Uncharacterized protein n=1 Tax=Mesorhizobium waimense TaxID=1300307 RepID=A0A3A5KEN1_9HYPH|nr:hypothetical protein [Mesorhizobium waimense]RJT32806.1 hypothetical protein D3227_25745 [Mesorhizobium waimense]